MIFFIPAETTHTSLPFPLEPRGFHGVPAIPVKLSSVSVLAAFQSRVCPLKAYNILP